MLCCVFYKNELIGRFHKKEKAIQYLMDRCWFDDDDMNNVSIKTMTKEEYYEYCRKMLDNTI